MALALSVAGCTSVSYYAESLGGHVKLMSAKKDVARLIADPSTPAKLRAQMISAKAIRQFAIDELALPDNNSYRTYVDVGPEAVSWAVFAAPEFSLTPKAWCFAVFGCVPYRAYFSKKRAIELAAELQGQGLDVHIGGVTAYSTLGWSSDPLLSTMFAGDDIYLAETVFHELAHQLIYINDDSVFNESFAVAVETVGTRQWLRAHGNTAGLSRYEADRKRRADFVALVSRTQGELRQIYDGSATAEGKRAAKAAVIETLRTRYKQMRDGRWGGYRGYDAWFATPINNAKLAAVAVYSDQVAGFMRLFELCGGDYPQFYAAVRQLGAVEKAKRGEALDAADSCSGGGLS
jgi:predicted aminopeptidase